jgi:hypothetical protein
VQFMLLIYEDESIYGPDKDGSAMQQIVAKHMAFNRELGAVRVGGAGLKSTTSATTVRTAKGRQSIHDGPFAESKEQLGGYYLIDVPDLDAAIAVAKKVPVLQDGSIEIRPVLGPG